MLGYGPLSSITATSFMFLFLSIQKDPIKNPLLMDFKIATSNYVSETVLGASRMTNMQFSNYLQEENGEQQLGCSLYHQHISVQ